MKRIVIVLVFTFCCVSTLRAVKPIETEGLVKYKNSFKIDLVSLGYVAPEIEWEHYTSTRFSYGGFLQAHFINRSSFRDAERSPGKITIDGETYDEKWDRRFAGVMICPQVRYYCGRKPDRGFFCALRVDMGLFQESFDVKRRLVVEGEGHDESDFRKLRNEKGGVNLAMGLGLGIGYQFWFRENSHWGIDINGFLKWDGRVYDSKSEVVDRSGWEWFWGPGLPGDWNMSLMYRF